MKIFRKLFKQKDSDEAFIYYKKEPKCRKECDGHVWVPFIAPCSNSCDDNPVMTQYCLNCRVKCAYDEEAGKYVYWKHK